MLTQRKISVYILLILLAALPSPAFGEENTQGLPFGLTQEFSFSFRKRIGSEEYFLLDSPINKSLKFEKGKANFFINLSNIFNTEYPEQGDVKMPGFTAFCGASVEF